MMRPGGAGGQEELPGLARGVQDLHTALCGQALARTYWEHTGPKQWREVVVRVRYGPGPGRDRVGPVFPDLTMGRAAPRNVLVERGDGTTDVRPVRLLRLKQPS